MATGLILTQWDPGHRGDICGKQAGSGSSVSWGHWGLVAVGLWSTTDKANGRRHCRRPPQTPPFPTPRTLASTSRSKRAAERSQFRFRVRSGLSMLVRCEKGSGARMQGTALHSRDRSNVFRHNDRAGTVAPVPESAPFVAIFRAGIGSGGVACSLVVPGTLAL